MDVKFRPRGGQDGFAPTDAEMAEASKRRYPGTNYPDLAIPVGLQNPICKDEVHSARPVYWELDNGQHGWACSQCGVVIQWG